MHLMVVGKYPPIQGGVAAATYQTVQTMLSRGHRVTVLTNSADVDLWYRCLLPSADEKLLGLLDRQFRLICPPPLPVHSYVPWSRPFVSMLYGAGLEAIALDRPDGILGWYFEPYGFVAGLLGQESKLQYFLQAAGSDIGNLAKHPALKSTYSAVAKRAASVLVGAKDDGTLNRWSELGVSSDQLTALQPCRLPALFRPVGPKLDLDRTSTDVQDWLKRFSTSSDLPVYGTLRATATSRHAAGTRAPVIGVYGKVGQVKGTFQLCDALDGLAQRGIPFTFLLLACGRPETLQALHSRLSAAPALMERTLVLPPLPPWRIPEFLRYCDITCCLENRFPVSFHNPRLPREILACGSLLFVSEEVANKQPFSSSLVSGKNCVIVHDPNDPEELTRQIQHTLGSGEMKVIAKHGWYLSKSFESLLPESDATADAIEDYLT